MANLLPQSGNQWMRWIERRLSTQESRRASPTLAETVVTQRYAARMNGDFLTANNTLYNVGYNFGLPYLHKNDGMFTYGDLGGGRIGVGVTVAGLYQVECSLQWAIAPNASSGVRKLYLLRPGQLVGDYNDEAAGAPAGQAQVSRVSGLFNLAAGEGVAVYAKQNSGTPLSILTMVGAGNAGDPAALSTFVMWPVGASS